MQHPDVQNLWMATPGNKMVADIRAGSWTEGDALCTKDVLYTMTFFSTGRNYPKKNNYRNALFTAVLLQDQTTGNNPSVHGPLEGRQPAHAPPAQTGDLLLVGDRVRGSVPPRVHAGQNVRRDTPERVSACIFTNISGKRQKLRPGVAPRTGSRHGAGGNILTIFLFVSLRIKIL